MAVCSVIFNANTTRLNWKTARRCDFSESYVVATRVAKPLYLLQRLEDKIPQQVKIRKYNTKDSKNGETN